MIGYVWCWFVFDISLLTMLGMYILRYFCHKKYFKHFTFWRRIIGYLVSKKILRHFPFFVRFQNIWYSYIYYIYFDIEKTSFLSKIHIFVLITGCFQRIHTVSWNHYSQHSKPNSHILAHFSKSVIVYCKMQVPVRPLNLDDLLREFSEVDWLSMESKPRDMGGTCTCESQTSGFVYCYLLDNFIIIIILYWGSEKQGGTSGW